MITANAVEWDCGDFININSKQLRWAYLKGCGNKKTVRINWLTATADISVLHISHISSLITVSFCGKRLHYLVCTWHYQMLNTRIHPQSGTYWFPLLQDGRLQTVSLALTMVTAVASIIVPKLFTGLGQKTIQATCLKKKHCPTQEAYVSPAIISRFIYIVI